MNTYTNLIQCNSNENKNKTQNFLDKNQENNSKFSNSNFKIFKNFKNFEEDKFEKNENEEKNPHKKHIFKIIQETQEIFEEKSYQILLGKKINKKRKVEWTESEDIKLSNLISIHGKKNWKEIASHFENKSRKKCFLRWKLFISKDEKLNKLNLQNSKNSQIKKNPWTKKEDEIILQWVKNIGVKNFTKCSKLFSDKTPKDCKNRWFNKLYFENLSSIHSDIWTKKDEFLIALFIKKFGTCWSKLQNFFENKTANQIKNKFNCLMRFFNKLRDNESSENNNNSQENLDNFIYFLIYNEDEFVKKQNFIIFMEAKKEFLMKLNKFFTNENSNKNPNINNCLRKLNEIKNPNEIKELNVCNKCMILLRNHIKNRIIYKIKQTNVELNANLFGGNDNKNEDNFTEMKIIQHIPALFDVINNIKEKIIK